MASSSLLRGQNAASDWQQDEEVAQRLRVDMKRAEAEAEAQRARDRDYGHAVAEAARLGLSVERPWEQEEEVYQRLSEQMAAFEARGFPRASSHDALAPRPALARPARPAVESPRATEDANLIWAAEEELYWRLADEMRALEELGHRAQEKPAKWIPKSSMRPSASDGEVNAWEQTHEVFARLVDEMKRLEGRADERLAAERSNLEGAQRNFPPLETDRSAYERLQVALRAVEREAARSGQGAALPRNTSRGKLLATDSYDQL